MVAQEQRRRRRNTAKRGGSGIALELARALPQEALLKPGSRHPAELTLLLSPSGRPPNFAREAQRAAQCGVTFVGALGTPQPHSTHIPTSHCQVLALTFCPRDTWTPGELMMTFHLTEVCPNKVTLKCTPVTKTSGHYCNLTSLGIQREKF